MICRRNRVFGFGAAPDGLSHGLIRLVSALFCCRIVYPGVLTSWACKLLVLQRSILSSYRALRWRVLGPHSRRR